MGLARLVKERAGDPSYNGPFYTFPNGFGLASSAYTGMNGLEDALKNAASWACIRVLMDAYARTPIKAVRELAHVRLEVSPQPKILVRPSGVVPADIWRSQLAFSVLTDGNVFANVADVDNAGRPEQLEIIDPTRVTDREIKNGVPTVKVDWKTHELYPFGDIWHMPGDMVLPGGPFGVSPISYARKIIGTSLAAEDFSFRFFDDGGHPPVAFIADHELDEGKADEWKRNYQKAMKGKREPLVMGDGFNIHEFRLDPSNTMFIDLMRFCVEQACRFWGVPPTMIFAAIGGQHMTYSNVTQADLHFLKNSLEGKYVRLETSLSELLPGVAHSAPSVPNTIALCDRDAVLKADVKTRYDTHQVALTNRFKTINEVRAEEGDPPFEGEEFNIPGVPPFAPTVDPNGVDLGNGLKLTQTIKPQPKPTSGTPSDKNADGGAAASQT